jgi:hypothetical protein
MVNDVKFWLKYTILKRAKIIDVKMLVFTSTSTIMVSFDLFEPADTVSVLLFLFPL